MDKLRKQLFEAMRCDIGVMAEWGDDEAGLWEEIMTADEEIIEEYRETFLED